MHPYPSGADDRALSGPVLFGRGELPGRDLYWIWNARIDRWALRYQDWKIVKYGRGEPKIEDWQLFFLKDEPQEKRDLGSRSQEKVAEMHRRFLLQRRKDLKGEGG